MKKTLVTIATTLCLLGISVPANASEIKLKEVNNDIIIGSVENGEFGVVNEKKSNDQSFYNLDFSTLNVKLVDGKIESTIDYKKIDNIAKAKSFDETQKSRVIDNAMKTQEILENDLNTEKDHKDLMNIVESHNDQTGHNPVIGVQEFKMDPTSIVEATRASGTPESTSNGKLYTSTSGSPSSLWAQTNLTLNKIYGSGAYSDGLGLSWSSPWQLSNNYKISVVSNVSQNLIRPTRVWGGTHSLAYKYRASSITGAYLGGTLVDGKRGGNSFYSTYIRTYGGYDYSFGAGYGTVGITVSPTSKTETVASHVYTTL